MLEQLTARQLVEWEIFDKIDPVGEWKIDYRLAYGLTTITNLFIAVYGKKGSKLAELKDYVIEWDVDKPKKAQSVEEMKSILLSFAESHNRRVKKRQPKRRPRLLKNNKLKN